MEPNPIPIKKKRFLVLIHLLFAKNRIVIQSLKFPIDNKIRKHEPQI